MTAVVTAIAEGVAAGVEFLDKHPAAANALKEALGMGIPEEEIVAALKELMTAAMDAQVDSELR